MAQIPNPSAPPETGPLPGASETAPKPPYNLLAVLAPIIGFVCSFLPVGLALGIVALQRIKHTRERGRWLAWTAIAMNSAMIVFFLIVLIFVAVTDDDPPDRPSPAAVPAKGDCFVAATAAETPTTFDDIRVVPCTRVHTGEIYALFTIDSQAPTPDPTSLRTLATARCAASARDFLPSSGIALAPRDAHFLLPDSRQWEMGQRTVGCYARDSGVRLTGPEERRTTGR
ncbi:septum formation family protein [Embleya sp. NPDC020886]|uniref:DUF4190 domain-containing protein n=1 Tax=Embleya sp. NPDC020886 TaxID=3363980 RepID=UPI0037BD16A9